MLFIAKSIERIGDHAMNIAEHVVYVAHGQDVRFEKSQAAALGDKR
jgi:phosphate transport system protein